MPTEPGRGVRTLTAPGIRVRMVMRMANAGLVPVDEAVRRLKEAGVGRDATYALARKHGVKLGRRLYLPRPLLEGLLSGDLEAVRRIREEGNAR